MNARLSELSRVRGRRARARGCRLPASGRIARAARRAPARRDGLAARRDGRACVRPGWRAATSSSRRPSGRGSARTTSGSALTVTLEPRASARARPLDRRLSAPWFPRVVIVNGHGGNRGWLGALGTRGGVPRRELLGARRAVPPAGSLSRRPRFDRPRRSGRDVGDARGRAGPRAAGPTAFEPISAGQRPVPPARHGRERRARRPVARPLPTPESGSSAPPAVGWRSCLDIPDDPHTLDDQGGRP